ncbi:MAG: radical SAM protein [Candidatus Omnitrophica bacterium]|nr:radical SAM protein [Candidatus Omnitrophota bacterium]
MKETIPEIEYHDFSSAINDKGYDLRMPIRGQIELTYKCNIRCVHCYTDCHNNPQDIQKELSYEEVLRMIDEIHEAGCLWLCLTGGEIFMRKDFFDIYDYAKKKGFLLILFTNVTIITPEIADRLAKDPPFLIETSCHGGTEEVFDAVTQVPGSFKRFVEGLRLLVERKLPVKVKTKAMTLNRGRLHEIKELVESFGLEFRFSTDIYPDLNGSLKPCAYRLTPEEIVELEINGEDIDTEDRCVEISDEPTDRLYRCGCGTNTFHVSAWGELGTCTFIGEPRVSLKHYSFQEAIQEVFPKIRTMTYQTDSPCRQCTVYSMCGKMPFPARFENGESEMPVDHFCQTAHLLAEKIRRR